MSRVKHNGVCHICGKNGKLTFEHVPPRAAYNDRTVICATVEQMLKEDWDGSHGRQQQKGSGGYTLCDACNNNTGAWYGEEYVWWVEQGLTVLDHIDQDDPGQASIRFYGKPLRFLKQAITMIFSANGDGFWAKHPDLVKFVLDFNARNLPPQYKVEVALVKGRFARLTGVYGVIDTDTNQLTIASEVAHCPFAFRLIFGWAPKERCGSIEHFAQYDYNEVREEWIDMTVGEVFTKFPGDYRSRYEVEREIAKSEANDE